MEDGISRDGLYEGMDRAPGRWGPGMSPWKYGSGPWRTARSLWRPERALEVCLCGPFEGENLPLEFNVRPLKEGAGLSNTARAP